MEGASSRRVQAGRWRKAAAGERRAMRGTWIEKKELAAAGVAALRAMASFFSFYKTKRSGLTKTGTAG